MTKSRGFLVSGLDAEGRSLVPVLFVIAAAVLVGCCCVPTYAQEPQPASTLPGAPSLRDRDAQASNQLSQKSLEELIDNLNDPEVPQLILSVLRNSVSPAQGHYEQVVFPRRTLRLIDLINQMPPDDRRAQCQDIFRQAMAGHQEVFEAVMRAAENPSAPRNERSMLGSIAGVCTAIFVSAHFDGVDTVLGQLQSTEQFAAYVRERMDRSEVYTSLKKANMNRYVEPDLPFKMSVVAYALDIDPSIDAEAKREALAILMRLPQVELPMLRWDAKTAVSDSNHLLAHAGIHEDDIQRTVVSFRLDPGGPTKMGQEDFAREWSAVRAILAARD